MESPSEDKQWATKYLLDPLTAPGPSEETGPGSQFTPPAATKEPSVTTTPANYSKTASVSTYPTPPSSASPTQSSFHPSNPFSPTHRQAAFGAYESGRSRKSLDEPVGKGKGHRRNSSLGERFPGDMSHRPLHQLRKETTAADRSPHLKKRHMPGPDIIDSLDRSIPGMAYHHEGPYDATLLARNTSHLTSPVAAVKETNEEALRATPREHIRDALDKHVPLQGTAIIPPGMVGMDGRPMQYEEGADLMREQDAPGGAYKRWDGVKYLPGDFKGKGEPSYSIEKALKDHKHEHRRNISDGKSGYEMQIPTHRPGNTRQRSASGSHPSMPSERPFGNALRYADFEGDMRRSNTTGRHIGEGLKKRFGSLRRGKKPAEAGPATSRFSVE